jgi:hypothetical protein
MQHSPRPLSEGPQDLWAAAAPSAESRGESDLTWQQRLGQSTAVPIPPFGVDGWLPEGVHDASLAEVRERFGRFRRTDRRVRLFEALEAFIVEARTSGLVVSIVLDGSFTSAADNPGDVDILVVLRETVKTGADIRPDQYNVVSAARIRRRYLLDAWVTSEDRASVQRWLEFFAQVPGRPGPRKGMVRLIL